MYWAYTSLDGIDVVKEGKQGLLLLVNRVCLMNLQNAGVCLNWKLFDKTLVALISLITGVSTRRCRKILDSVKKSTLWCSCFIMKVEGSVAGRSSVTMDTLLKFYCFRTKDGHSQRLLHIGFLRHTFGVETSAKSLRFLGRLNAQLKGK